MLCYRDFTENVRDPNIVQTAENLEVFGDEYPAGLAANEIELLQALFAVGIGAFLVISWEKDTCAEKKVLGDITSHNLAFTST